MTDTASVTQTVQSVGVVAVAAREHPGLVTGFIGWVLGILSHMLGQKVAKGITPADVAEAEADAKALAPIAQLGLSLAGQPAAAAILGRVVAAAQTVADTHATMVAVPTPATANAHADAVTALAAAVAPLAAAGK